jgi:FKBP-type peptidyl-prolyl cis-trans isomerase SlyD
MQFQAEGDDGEVIVTVTEVTDEEVTVDANHPLAGQTLHFEVEVVSVRPCTEEELAHGHIHGEGGHHH